MKNKKDKFRKQGSLIFSTSRLNLTFEEAEKIRREFSGSGVDLDLEACDGPGCRLCQLFAGEVVQRNLMH
jgi:hypothetical protein